MTDNPSQPPQPPQPPTNAPSQATSGQSAGPVQTAGPVQPAGKGVIAYDDFAKLDLRVGKIVEAVPHPNADKLICLTVELGDQRRQIIAGIRPWYTPEALVGKEVIVVANLAPRKMRGLESNGMLLAASAGEGDARTVVVLSPEREVPPGSRVS